MERCGGRGKARERVKRPSVDGGWSWKVVLVHGMVGAVGVQ
jgi:hypothetical protein